MVHVLFFAIRNRTGLSTKVIVLKKLPSLFNIFHFVEKKENICVANFSLKQTNKQTETQ